jgi:hypothetical protein
MKIVIYKNRNRYEQWQPFLPEVLSIIEVENYDKFVYDFKRNKLAISPREWSIVSLDFWKENIRYNLKKQKVVSNKT